MAHSPIVSNAIERINNKTWESSSARAMCVLLAELFSHAFQTRLPDTYFKSEYPPLHHGRLAPNCSFPSHPIPKVTFNAQAQRPISLSLLLRRPRQLCTRLNSAMLRFHIGSIISSVSSSSSSLPSIVGGHMYILWSSISLCTVSKW